MGQFIGEQHHSTLSQFKVQGYKMERKRHRQCPECRPSRRYPETIDCVSWNLILSVVEFCVNTKQKSLILRNRLKTIILPQCKCRIILLKKCTYTNGRGSSGDKKHAQSGSEGSRRASWWNGEPESTSPLNLYASYA